MTDPLIPAWFAITVTAVFGGLIGSFLNVVIWRLPRGMSVVHPRSACPVCKRPIAWYDNIPVLSYLVLRGRCRTCSTGISLRYPAVELLTAAAFAGVTIGAYQGVYPAAILPLLLFWAAAGIALALIDLDHHRLPDAITLPAYIVSFVFIMLATALTGDLSRLLPALIGLIALSGLYLLLAFGWREGMGLGDVKLAGSLGMTLGWFGWPQLIVGGFSAFIVGAIVGIALIIARRAGRKSGLPFGPFMLIGAAIGIFAGQPIADFYLTLVGLA